MSNDIVCLQETRFRDPGHKATFEFHVAARSSHTIFTSDFPVQPPPMYHHARGGVATPLSPRFLGASKARVIDSLTVPGRYLVVETRLGSRPTLVHNVYAPCTDTEKAVFFAVLERSQYPQAAQHIALSDFNIAADAAVGSATGAARDPGARASFLCWCAKLSVTDAWRVHHPDARVFSGPSPRCARLDYTLLTDSLLSAHYSSSEYFDHQHAGDHLVHRGRLKATATCRGPSFWRPDASMVQNPDVAAAIRGEAAALLVTLRVSSNSGSCGTRGSDLHGRAFSRSRVSSAAMARARCDARAISFWRLRVVMSASAAPGRNATSRQRKRFSPSNNGRWPRSLKTAALPHTRLTWRRRLAVSFASRGRTDALRLAPRSYPMGLRRLAKRPSGQRSEGIGAASSQT